MLRLLGLPLIAVGALFLGHAIYRARYPDWRDRGWWARNSLWAFLLDPPYRNRRVSQGWQERYASVIEGIVGMAWIVGGVLTPIHGGG
jgi:hypothetical protein